MVNVGPQRSRLQLDARRAQLVEVGLALFSDRAYDDIAIEDIAAAARISKGLLYHYFPSKRDFYVAVIRAAAADLLDRTEPEPDLPVLARLQASIDAYLDHVTLHARGYATLLRGGIGTDAEVRAIVDANRSALAERVLAALPHPVTARIRLSVRGWIGYVEAVSLEWVEQGRPDRDAVRDLLAGALGGALIAAGMPPLTP